MGFIDAEAFRENLVGMVDLAAARAGEIALEERLEHHRQRVALTPHETLFHQVAADAELLDDRNSHDSP